MVSIKNNVIVMTRSDTLRTTLWVQNVDGSMYTPSADDEIMFAAKQSADDEEYAIVKKIQHENMELHLAPSDTANLPFGDYYYDIQIKFANGDVNTFINKGKLKIREEIYCE